jgi:hypothetical protein
METNLDYLKAQLSVLLVHDLKFSDKLVKFQKALKKRFDVEYTIEDIGKELEILQVENDAMWQDAQNQVLEYPEDYYEGFN